MDVDPPHAVVVHEEAWFNLTLHTNHEDDSDEYAPKYGYVHFMWTFGENITRKPFLTWDYEVSHTFTTAGVYQVSVTAITLIGVTHGHATVTVYGEYRWIAKKFLINSL